jgi:serine/threonine-protein kinase
VYACIAKNPAERPASAAHLARAATALRRGDVQAAAAAVPAVLGADADTTGFTTLLMPAGAAGSTQATTVLSATETEEQGPEEGQEQKKKKRSPWTWPLIALIALLAIIQNETLIALLTQNHGTPAPTNTATHHTQTSTPTRDTPTSTPTPTSATINEADLKGKSYDDAYALLKSEGFTNISRNVGAAATSSAQVNLVYDVNPTGTVDFGTTVTLTVYASMTAPSTPTDTVTLVGGTATVNQPATFSFGAAQCPAGQKLNGRQLYVDGKGTGPVTTTQTQYTFDNTDQHSVTYTIFCGESTESAPSPAIQVTPVDSGADPTPAP